MLLRTGKAVETAINSAALNQIMDDHSSNSACSNDAEGNDRSHSSRSDISPPYHNNLNASPPTSPRLRDRDNSLSLIDPQDTRHILPNPIPVSLGLGLQAYRPDAGPRVHDDVVDGDQQHAPYIHFMAPPTGLELMNGYASTTRTDLPFEDRQGVDYNLSDYGPLPYISVDPADSPRTRTISRTSHELPNGYSEEYRYVDGAEALVSRDHNPIYRRGRSDRNPRVLEMNSPAHIRMDSQLPPTPHHLRGRRNPDQIQLRNGFRDQEDNQMDDNPHAYGPALPSAESRRMRPQDRHIDRTTSNQPTLVSTPEIPVYPNIRTRRRTPRSALQHEDSDAHEQATMISPIHHPPQTQIQSHTQPSYSYPPPPLSTSYDQTYNQTTHSQPQLPTFLVDTTRGRETPYTDYLPPWSVGGSAAVLGVRRLSYIPVIGMRESLVGGVGFGVGGGAGEEDMGRELDMLDGSIGIQPQSQSRPYGARQGRDSEMNADEEGDLGADRQQTKEEEEEDVMASARGPKRRRRHSGSTTSTTPPTNGHVHAKKKRHQHRRR